jgi:hypothetical protein
MINEDVVELSTSHSRVGTGCVDPARHRWCGRPKSARRMTIRKIDWSLSNLAPPRQAGGHRRKMAPLQN